MESCIWDLREECHQLLLCLKSTVEGLLVSQAPNVWNTYGGFSRLSSDVQRIFSHQLKTSEGICDYWQFLKGLCVLQPTMAPSIEKHRINNAFAVRGILWIEQSLQEHSLSSQLKLLLQDTEHATACYNDGAFLRHEGYSKAFLLCLQAVEQNNLALLAEINPNLLMKNSRKKYQTHSRSSSFPMNQVDVKACNSVSDTWICPEHLFDLREHDDYTKSKLLRTWSRDRFLLLGSHSHETAGNREYSIPRSLSDIVKDQLLVGKYLPLSIVCDKDKLHSETTSDWSQTDSRIPSHQPLDSSNNNEKILSNIVQRNFVQLDCSFHNKLSVSTSSSADNGSTDIGMKQSTTSLSLGSSFSNNGKNKINISGNHSVSLLHIDTVSRKKSDLEHYHIRRTVSESNMKAISTSLFRDYVKTPHYKETKVTVSKTSLLLQHFNDNEQTADVITEKNALFSSVYRTKSENDVANIQTEQTPLSETPNSKISPSLLQVDYSQNKIMKLHRKRTERFSDDAASTCTITDTTGGIKIVTENQPKNTVLSNSETRSTVNDLTLLDCVPSKKAKSHKRSSSDVTHQATKTITNKRLIEEPTLRHKSLLEEGGNSVVTCTECFFPQPTEGQSLTSFLSSQDFNTCAELDKENAHFSICEALIAAIEQIKCNEMIKKAEEDEEESDEEIQHLKQRIRIRRRERQQEKAQKTGHLLSDGRTDTTTSQSVSPFSSPQSSVEYPGSSTSDDVDELVLSDNEPEAVNKLVKLNDNGLSLSMASLYSDADIQRSCVIQSPNVYQDRSNSVTESTVSNMSAESVALSLLRKFSEKQLPKASDLEWLVSEQDAPQRLLPLPTSWPISPDEAENGFNQKTRIRGNYDWAPPRAQIIFNIHPQPKKKIILMKQNYRCAGCGMKIELGFIKRFRYCEYLGKYFCQCCHSNHMSYIPARILRKWDFSKYSVSNFSRDLVNKMLFDPLFNVADINSALYRRIKALDNVRESRRQLFYLKDFIRTCRNAEHLLVEFDKHPLYMFAEPDVYSLNDLILVKNGELGSRLKFLVNHATAHIHQCQLCEARGFICELCHKEEVIFPFQLKKVVQCLACWACYHAVCFVSDQCPKCARIEARKQKMSSSEIEFNIED